MTFRKYHSVTSFTTLTKKKIFTTCTPHKSTRYRHPIPSTSQRAHKYTHIAHPNTRTYTQKRTKKNKMTSAQHDSPIKRQKKHENRKQSLQPFLNSAGEGHVQQGPATGCKIFPSTMSTPRIIISERMKRRIEPIKTISF